jgi:small subunit ribosomal protein S2
VTASSGSAEGAAPGTPEAEVQTEPKPETNP